MDASIFDNHYEKYCRQINELNLPGIKDTLAIELRGADAIIPFFGVNYLVSGSGIVDEGGLQPDYGVCVILAKYLLLSPETPAVNEEWASLKDFHKRSQLTNFNVFASDAERPILTTFTGRLAALSEAAHRLGGKPVDLGTSYDLSIEFNALPRIKILLNFTDSDDEFPASCSLLFQKQAEEYLDPESLIMIGIACAHRLQRLVY